jgi:RNA polymerase sigma-70 factor, ECF subfamily
MADSAPRRLVVVSAPLSPALEARDDEDLMTLTGSDRREAFAALASRYLPRVARYCAKCTGNPRVGEELAQEALLEVWTQRHAYRSKGQFRIWLFTLARNRCLNHMRSERRRDRWLPIGAGAGLPGPEANLAPDQIDRLLAAERARQVRVALGDLGPKLREAVLLRFDQGLDYAEISRIVDAPEGTVRSRVFLALKQLRGALGREEEVP